jgi:hypothetical protein
MAAQVNKEPELETENSQLSKQDTRLLLVMCTELVNLCAKLTGTIDPAAALRSPGPEGSGRSARREGCRWCA